MEEARQVVAIQSAEHVSIADDRGRLLLTTQDAATAVGCSPATITKWVERGYLAPVNPGRKPSYFREFDVWQCARHRLGEKDRRRMAAQWNMILAELTIGGGTRI
jgi:hypothetical protein